MLSAKQREAKLLDQETRIKFAAQVKRQIEEHKQFVEQAESDGSSFFLDGQDITSEMIAKEREIIDCLEQLIGFVEKVGDA